MKFGLDFIRKLKPCTFRFNAPLDDGREHAGFIAQDVDEIVDGKKYGFVGKDKDGIYSLGYMEFIAPMVKAIQELDEKIRGLEGGVTNLFTEVVMLPVPEMQSVRRLEWIIDYCRGKKVLHLGCGDGGLHDYLLESAKELWGVDRKPCDYPNFIQADIEQDEWIPDEQFDAVIATEIIEHLLNVGLFFDKLKHFDCPIVITVPSAYSGGRFVTYARDGFECVHPEHTCWHSYYTLKTVVERCGFEILENMECYHSEDETGYASEGILFIIRKVKN